MIELVSHRHERHGAKTVITPATRRAPSQKHEDVASRRIPRRTWAWTGAQWERTKSKAGRVDAGRRTVPRQK